MQEFNSIHIKLKWLLSLFFNTHWHVSCCYRAINRYFQQTNFRQSEHNVSFSAPVLQNKANCAWFKRRLFSLRLNFHYFKNLGNFLVIIECGRVILTMLIPNRNSIFLLLINLNILNRNSVQRVYFIEPLILPVLLYYSE